jgi:dihydrofolate reductase
MSATVLYMSISLDGFVAGPNEAPDNGLGDGGERLHEWFSSAAPTGHSGVPGRPEGVSGELMDALTSTGAVVAGRGTVEPAGHWDGDHHDGVPIFILSRDRHEAEEARWPPVTYVGDGAGTAQLALAAGVLDELQIHLIPVLLGEGRRLFEHLGADHIELEQVRVADEPGVTHLRYRVRR